MFAHARRRREQTRTQAATLSKLRAADAIRSQDLAIRRTARALYVWVLGMWRVSYRGIMTATAVTIILVAIVTVTGIAWHGRGRWY
jgi:hypothetical protein